MSVVRSNSEPAKPPYKPHGRGNLDSYRLAFDESVRTLELLDKRLERVQTAYIAVLAFLGSAAAFLAGSVLTTLERTTQVRWLSSAATAMFAVALGLAIWDLWPRRRPGGVDAALIVQAYIEPDVAAPYELTLAKLATQNAEVAESVRYAMRLVSIRFALFLSMTTVSIALWVITAWVGKRIPPST
jgi:hypothetical protein